MTNCGSRNLPPVIALVRVFNGSASRRSHLRIAPRDVGLDAIGHFAFFHERFDLQARRNLRRAVTEKR